MTPTDPSPKARPRYRVNTVSVGAVWGWLDRAWADICMAYLPSLAYGLLFVVLGFAVTGGVLMMDMAWLVLPLVGGFLLVGPVLSIGLCEISRALEAGRRPSLWEALTAFQRNPSGLLVSGLVFMLLMLAWVRVAALMFALTFPYAGGSWNLLVVQTLSTLDGLVFLVVSTAVGAGFAVVAFSFGVVALPLMLDQREDFFRAAALSFQVVRANPGPLALWALLIALFIGAGLITAFVGLVPSLMLIGHATWHAYRALISVEGEGESV